MKEQDFDKIIGSKLREFSQQPPDELFSRIEKTLAADGSSTIAKTQKKHQWLAPVWKYASIAALVCALLATSLYLRNTYNAMPEAEIANNLTENTINTNNTTSQIATNREDTPTNAQPLSKVNNAAINKHANNNTTIALKTDIEEQPSQNNTAAEVIQNNTTSVTINEDSIEGLTLINDDNSNLKQRSAEYWDKILAAESSMPHTKRKTAISLFTDNFKTNGRGTSTNDSDQAARYGMLLQQNSNNNSTPLSGLTEDNGNPVNAPLERYTQAINLKHYMPVTVGVGVSINISSYIAINTGVNYSYLLSTAEQSFTTSQGNTKREVHYIGIPVGVSYKFFNKKGFNLYIYGGGTIEKAVALRETYNFTNALDNSNYVVNKNVKNVQLSVTASAGASYNINKNIALYLEPGISYYFDQRDQPANYRTANPTSFSLKLGLRFGL